MSERPPILVQKHLQLLKGKLNLRQKSANFPTDEKRNRPNLSKKTNQFNSIEEKENTPLPPIIMKTKSVIFNSDSRLSLPKWKRQSL